MRSEQLPNRILMTSDTVGGVWTYSLELCAGLAEDGVEVHLATMGRTLSDSQRRAARRVPRLKVWESSYKLEWMEDPWEDVSRAGGWLLDLEERVRPDLIHLNGYAHGDLPWKAPVVTVGHSCVLSWWRAVKAEAAPAGWAQYQDTVRRGLQAADYVVAPSCFMLDALETHYGRLRRRQVIYNGRAAVIGESEVKEELVLTAGRLWDAAKNIETLMAVSGEIEWPICVAGDWGERDADQRRDGGVQWLGFLESDALVEWMGRAAIYTLPARYEPFGLSALEAAMNRCALVLGDIPSLREIWQGAALFVAPDDRNGLRRVLRRLIEHPADRAELARRASERALLFTRTRMTRQYASLYNEVLRSRRPSGKKESAYANCNVLSHAGF